MSSVQITSSNISAQDGSKLNMGVTINGQGSVRITEKDIKTDKNSEFNRPVLVNGSGEYTRPKDAIQVKRILLVTLNVESAVTDENGHQIAGDFPGSKKLMKEFDGEFFKLFEDGGVQVQRFNSTPRFDANISKIDDAFRWVKEEMEEECDLVVFCISGHSDAEGKHFMARDGKYDLQKSVDQLLEFISDKKHTTTIALFLQTCFGPNVVTFF